MRMRSLLATGICFVSLVGVSLALLAAGPGQKITGKNPKVAAPAAPKAGVKTPGIQIPFANLKADLEVPVDTPGWITVADTLVIPNRSKDVLVRVDLKAGDPLAAAAPRGGGARGASGDSKVADAKVADPADSKAADAKAADPADAKVADAKAAVPADAKAADAKAAVPADSKVAILMGADTKAADAPVSGGRGGRGGSGGGGRGGRGGGRGGSGRGGAPAAPAPTTPIATQKGPCSNTLAAFGNLWVATCGEQGLARIDQKTSKVIASLPVTVGDAMTGLAATADSVWMLTDNKTTLARIDPVQNKVVAELRIPAGCNNLEFGETSLWVTCPSEARILRINPETNLVDKRIEVSAGARAIAFGAGSVWVLCDKEGKVDRIDPKLNKVIKTIELGVPNGGGNLAFGDGFVWVTQTGFPLTRIDPETDKEKVAQQFWGEGGGLITVTNGAIWLSNTSNGSVWRLDPRRVYATLAE
jgi:virginiamycin B lyase